MIQQPVSKGWPLFHCVCFISTAIVSLQFGVGILIYIFHIFFPIFIFNSYWFVVVAVVAMWIYLRESLVSLSLSPLRLNNIFLVSAFLKARLVPASLAWVGF